ncbi:hypothetical protein GDO78_005303 [Eleutherodactylus coqui]|uniref:Uncharacterized protein n=1 Tax=Eleutherodactylus coqui TaxID=57060 RepID=A0A8J6FJN1_ELECQ|nr:hypothetical protein GDO78_005303 [Eleutherodactylus coqui]
MGTSIAVAQQFTQPPQILSNFSRHPHTIEVRLYIGSVEFTTWIHAFLVGLPGCFQFNKITFFCHKEIAVYIGCR